MTASPLAVILTATLTLYPLATNYQLRTTNSSGTLLNPYTYTAREYDPKKAEAFRIVSPSA